MLLEVTTDDRFIDLATDDIDVVIRANPRPDDSLVGRCFLRNQLVLVARPDLLRPASNPTRTAQSTVAAVMRSGSSDNDIWTVLDTADGNLCQYHPEAVLRLSSPLTIRDAVLTGAGAALVPRTVVDEDLAAGRLVSWGSTPGPQIEVWVLHASGRLVSPKVRAFVNFVCERFAPVVG